MHSPSGVLSLAPVSAGLWAADKVFVDVVARHRDRGGGAVAKPGISLHRIRPHRVVKIGPCTRKGSTKGNSMASASASTTGTAVCIGGPTRESAVSGTGEKVYLLYLTK